MKAIKIASVTALAAAISAQSMATNFVSGADLTVSGSLNTAVNFDILNGGGSTSSTGSVGLKVTDGNFNAGLTLMGIRDFATACDKGTTVQDKPGLDLATNMVTVANNKDNFLGCETDEKYGPSGVQDFTVNAGNWSFGEIGALPLAKLFPWEGGFVQGDSGIAGQSTGFGGYGVDYAIRYDSAGLLYGNNIGYWDYKGWAVQVEGQNAANANSGAVYDADGAEIQAAAGAKNEEVGAALYYYDYLNDRTIVSFDAKARQMGDAKHEYGVHAGAAMQTQVAKGLSIQAGAQLATDTGEDAFMYADAGLEVGYKIKSYFTMSATATYNMETKKDKADSALKAEYNIVYNRKGISASSASGVIVMLDKDADNLTVKEIVKAGYNKDGISAGAEATVSMTPTEAAPDTDMVLTAAVFAGWNNDGNDIAFEDDVLSFSARFDFANDMADNNGNQEQKAYGVVVGNKGNANEADKLTLGASYSAEIMSDVTLTVSLDDTFNMNESALNVDATNVLVQKAAIAIAPIEDATITFAQTIKHETEEVDGEAKGITENGFSVSAAYSF